MGQTIISASAVAAVSRWRTTARRTGHGATAWAQDSQLLQPQDGANDSREAGDGRGRVMQIGSRLPRPKAVAMVEPEDAGITGGTRSLVRRLLGLNIPTPRIPATPKAKTPSRVALAKQAQVA